VSAATVARGPVRRSGRTDGGLDDEISVVGGQGEADRLGEVVPGGDDLTARVRGLGQVDEATGPFDRVAAVVDLVGDLQQGPSLAVFTGDQVQAPRRRRRPHQRGLGHGRPGRPGVGDGPVVVVRAHAHQVEGHRGVDLRRALPSQDGEQTDGVLCGHQLVDEGAGIGRSTEGVGDPCAREPGQAHEALDGEVVADDAGGHHGPPVIVGRFVDVLRSHVVPPLLVGA
jgi:hypothetical protein